MMEADLYLSDTTPNIQARGEVYLMSLCVQDIFVCENYPLYTTRKS